MANPKGTTIYGFGGLQITEMNMVLRKWCFACTKDMFLKLTGSGEIVFGGDVKFTGSGEIVLPKSGTLYVYKINFLSPYWNLGAIWNLGSPHGSHTNFRPDLRSGFRVNEQQPCGELSWQADREKRYICFGGRNMFVVSMGLEVDIAL